MTKIQKSALTIVGLLLFGVVVALTSRSTVDAAICYTETGPFRVQTETHSCPAPGNGTGYVDSAGNPVTNPQSLPNSRCFVLGLQSSSVPGRNYVEQRCTDLETLRTNVQREACEEAGGNFSMVPDSNSPSQYSGTCSCTQNFVYANGDCIRPERAEQLDKTLNGDCREADVNSDNCAIVGYLVLFINILSALVGIAVAASIIYGGIQYASSGGDPQKVAAAKERIRNAIIALVFFIFTYSFLNYLVPGGVL